MLHRRLSSAIILVTLSYLMIQSSYLLNHTTGNIDSYITSSCTIFTSSIGDKVLFGNNEDFKYNNAYRWYMPAQNVSTTYFGIKEIYGAVFFGFDNNEDSTVDGWEQGGMNEHGLCYDANGLPDVTLNLDPSASYPYTSHAIAQVLWDCRTVEEVISWYENIKWSGTLGAQFHYADSTGDAVVVGVDSTGQWVFTRKVSDYIVSTNFDLNDTSHGSYPCARYDTATQMLDEITTEEDLNVSACADILYAVHQEGMYATKYSNICDPVNKLVYFCSGDEYSEQERFNLTEILANVDTSEGKSSFMGVDATETNLLVKTDQIDVQFETIPTTEETISSLIVSMIGLILIAFTCIGIRKKNRK